MKLDGRIEPIILILVALMVFYTGALFFAEVKFSSDGVFFQVVAGVLTGVVGAFLARIKGPSEKAQVEDPASSITITKEVAKETEPPK